MGDPTLLYPRLLEPALLDRLRRSPVVVLTGARQVGKTTLVRSVPAAASRRFLTLDSLTTLDQARREPEALVEAPEPITVDEVQRAPDLLIAIKRAADADERHLWFDGYVDTYVQKDLRDLAQVGDLAAFVRLMRLAALRTGGLLNQAELGRDASVSRTSAQRWLSILEASFLLTLL